MHTPRWPTSLEAAPPCRDRKTCPSNKNGLPFGASHPTVSLKAAATAGRGRGRSRCSANWCAASGSLPAAGAARPVVPKALCAPTGEHVSIARYRKAGCRAACSIRADHAYPSIFDVLVATEVRYPLRATADRFGAQWQVFRDQAASLALQTVGAYLECIGRLHRAGFRTTGQALLRPELSGCLARGLGGRNGGLLGQWNIRQLPMLQVPGAT